MQPLNTFPALLDFARLSPFIIRIVIGLFIIYLGRERTDKKFSALSLTYYFCGVFLIIGFYTQLSSLAGIALLKFDFYVDYWQSRKTKPVPKYFYFLYAITVLVLVSLLFSGAGLFAFDMPF